MERRTCWTMKSTDRVERVSERHRLVGGGKMTRVDKGVKAACADWFESHTNAVPRKFGPINAAAV